MTTVLGRVFPRYTTEKEDPPTDFPVGELVANEPTGSLFFKKANGEVLVIPGLERVQQIAGNGGGPVVPTWPRVLFANHEPVLWEQVGWQTLRSFTVPAGTLTPSSRLDVRVQASPENGSNHELRLEIGENQIASVKTRSGRTYILERSLRRRGETDSFISDSWGGNLTSVSGKFGQVDVLTLLSNQDLLIECKVRHTSNSQRFRVDSFEVVLWP